MDWTRKIMTGLAGRSGWHESSKQAMMRASMRLFRFASCAMFLTCTLGRSIPDISVLASASKAKSMTCRDSFVIVS